MAGQQTVKAEPGYKAQEEAKAQADEAQEKAAQHEDPLVKVDPSSVEIDREIAQHLTPHNELDVTDQQPGWRYKWVFTGLSGRFISQAKFDGWLMVQGKDPEAEELRWTDGTRKLADVILFKIPEAKYLALQERDRLARLRQQEGITSEIEELGRKHGIVVKKDFDARELSRMAQRAHARGQAVKQFDGMVRTGTVPGVRVR